MQPPRSQQEAISDAEKVVPPLSVRVEKLPRPHGPLLRPQEVPAGQPPGGWVSWIQWQVDRGGMLTLFSIPLASFLHKLATLHPSSEAVMYGYSITWLLQLLLSRKKLQPGATQPRLAPHSLASQVDVSVITCTEFLVHQSALTGVLSTLLNILHSQMPPWSVCVAVKQLNMQTEPENTTS